MQKLIEKMTVPPGGFRYLQSETRTWIEAPDYYELFRRVKDHRSANNIPLDNFWAEKVEHQLCETLPPGLCKEDPGVFKRNVFNRLDWNDVYNGTQAFAAWALKGFGQVDQNLANARGNVCSRCPYNVSISGVCAACGHLQNLAAAFTRGRVSSADPFLKACAVCKCSLRVKVWSPVEAISAGTPNTALYPDWCWIPKELEVFRAKKETVEV